MAGSKTRPYIAAYSTPKLLGSSWCQNTSPDWVRPVTRVVYVHAGYGGVGGVAGEPGQVSGVAHCPVGIPPIDGEGCFNAM